MNDDTVLIFSERITADIAEDATRPYRPVVVSDPNALAREIAAGRDILAVVIHIAELSARLEGLLRSIRHHFPVLPVVFVTDINVPADIDGRYERIPDGMSTTELAATLRSRLGDLATRDRRRYHRYDWPLTGSVIAPPEQATGPQETPFRIRSLSAGGAFLEQQPGMPEPGTDIILRVCFQDSSFSTDCHVLERRMASSNLPPGQGVQFTSLSDAARELIDRIVSDALMTILLDPGAEPEVPTIGDDDLEMSMLPEFTLD